MWEVCACECKSKTFIQEFIASLYQLFLLSLVSIYFVTIIEKIKIKWKFYGSVKSSWNVSLQSHYDGIVFFKKMGQPWPLFCLFPFFFKHNLYRITVGVSGIRTRIVGVEGEHADHLTTTTARASNVYSRFEP